VSPVNPAPPLTQAGFLVLLALASGEAHGYAVMQFAEETTEGRVRLPPGTLYRTISRLLADGLVEEIAGQDPDAASRAATRDYPPVYEDYPPVRSNRYNNVTYTKVTINNYRPPVDAPRVDVKSVINAVSLVAAVGLYALGVPADISTFGTYV
jgi:hypothetical protein